eukprot:3089389-Amphidinium_carterae.2
MQSAICTATATWGGRWTDLTSRGAILPNGLYWSLTSEWRGCPANEHGELCVAKWSRLQLQPRTLPFPIVVDRARQWPG